MKVTVVGAGFYGSTLAARVAEAGYATEVVLTDIAERIVTYDFARLTEGATEVKTSEFAAAIVERL